MCCRTRTGLCCAGHCRRRPGVVDVHVGVDRFAQRHSAWAPDPASLHSQPQPDLQPGPRRRGPGVLVARRLGLGGWAARPLAHRLGLRPHGRHQRGPFRRAVGVRLHGAPRCDALLSHAHRAEAPGGDRRAATALAGAEDSGRVHGWRGAPRAGAALVSERSGNRLQRVLRPDRSEPPGRKLPGLVPGASRLDGQGLPGAPNHGGRRKRQ